MDAYRQLHRFGDYQIVAWTDEGQKITVSFSGMWGGLSMSEPGVRLSVFKAVHRDELGELCQERLSTQEFIQKDPLQNEWQAWVAGRVAALTEMLRFFDEHPWLANGVKSDDDPLMPSDVIMPGLYEGEEGCLWLVERPSLRDSRFQVRVLHLRTGRAMGTKTVGADALEPARRLTSKVWLDAMDHFIPENGSDLTRSRVRGCLLGGAIGDALGAAVNSLSLGQIRKCYGPNGIREFSPAFGRLGAITAHTQLTMFTVEGMIRASIRGKSKGICDPAAVVYYALLRWMLTQKEPMSPRVGLPEPLDGWLFKVAGLHVKRDPSKTVRDALREPIDWNEEARPVNQSKGCGAAVRSVAAGLTGWDPYEYTPRFAALTHGHPTAKLAAGFVADLAARLARCGGVRDALDGSKANLRGQPDHAQLLGAVERAEAFSAIMPASAETVERLGKGWTCDEAVSIAVYCLLRSSDFESGVRLAVNHGGDSDATGSIAGSLLGVLYGDRAIPARWLEDLELRDEIETLADDLFLEFSGFPYAGFLGGSDWEKYPGW